MQFLQSELEIHKKAHKAEIHKQAHKAEIHKQAHKAYKNGGLKNKLTDRHTDNVISIYLKLGLLNSNQIILQDTV